MHERESIELTELTMCYLGPLFLLMLPGYVDETPLKRRTIREGMLLFLSFLGAFLVLRLLSGAPIFGVLFQAALILLWMMYVIIVVWIIVQKHSDAWFQIPFLSAYADQLDKN